MRRENGVEKDSRGLVEDSGGERIGEEVRFGDEEAEGGEATWNDGIDVYYFGGERGL